MKFKTLFKKYPDNVDLQKLSEFDSEIKVKTFLSGAYTFYNIIFKPKSYESFLKFKKAFELTDENFNCKELIKNYIDINANFLRRKTPVLAEINISSKYKLEFIDTNKFSGSFWDTDFFYEINTQISWDIFFKDKKSKKEAIRDICRNILIEKYKIMFKEFNATIKAINFLFNIDLNSLANELKEEK